MQQTRLGRQQLGLGLLELGLIRVLLDDKQNLPFVDDIAFLEQDLLEIPLDPRTQLHGVKRLRVAGEFEVACHLTRPRMTDRHLGRRRRLIGIRAGIATGETQAGQEARRLQQPDRTPHRTRPLA